MIAKLIYSGYTRTYDQCKSNHMENITGAELCETHRNETTNDLEHYKFDDYTYNSNKAPETIVRCTLNQWYNNFMSFVNVKKEDSDVFIRMRYDIKIHGLIDLSEYSYNDNTIYIPKGHDYRLGVNDQLAFGNYEAMKAYYSVYLNHQNIFRDGHMFHTESYLHQNMKNQNIDIKRIDINTEIIR